MQSITKLVSLSSISSNWSFENKNDFFPRISMNLHLLYGSDVLLHHTWRPGTGPRRSKLSKPSSITLLVAREILLWNVWEAVTIDATTALCFGLTSAATDPRVVALSALAAAPWEAQYYRYAQYRCNTGSFTSSNVFLFEFQLWNGLALIITRRIMTAPAINMRNPTTAPTIVVIGTLDFDAFPEARELSKFLGEGVVLLEPRTDVPVLSISRVPAGSPLFIKFLFRAVWYSTEWSSIYAFCVPTKRIDVWTLTAVVKSSLTWVNLLVETSLILRTLTFSGLAPEAVATLSIYSPSNAMNSVWDMGNVTTMTTVT